MKIVNEMKVDFLAVPENESFARLVVSAFILSLNPTIEQLGDVRTAVSEAVTNAIVHGYRMQGGTVRMRAMLSDTGLLTVDVIDNGCGIEDIERARQPFYSSAEGAERSGMGFTVMESFMDCVEVVSTPGIGTTIRLIKDLSPVSIPIMPAREA